MRFDHGCVSAALAEAGEEEEGDAGSEAEGEGAAASRPTAPQVRPEGAQMCQVFWGEFGTTIGTVLCLHSIGTPGEGGEAQSDQGIVLL